MISMNTINIFPHSSLCLSKTELHCVGTQFMTDWRRKPRKENVAGDFFVDHTCIDCDACRWLSPSVFKRSGDGSAVLKQPSTQEERISSIQALLSCPTSSIHLTKSENGEVNSVRESFPLKVPGCENVLYCGFADEKTFGASSYFVKSNNGNVLIDCPKFNSTLVNNLKSLGGFDFIFITHKHDVGDHEKWALEFKAKRIIHKMDVEPSTQGCEIQLEGDGPWSVGPKGDIKEMEIISAPGHTEGSICLIHKPSLTIFTGDHFAYSGVLDALSIFERFNHFSVVKQFENVLKLCEFDFVRVLPGHGRKIETESTQAMKKLIKDFVAQKTSS